jgi:electron transfer flavoprotein beta subunit
MKILVLIKEVPDTYGDRVLDLETGLADRTAGDVVVDEIGERALEVALTHAEANPGTDVVVLTMAPESATTSVRKGLAIGADSAVHVASDALRGADLGLTAEVLASAAKRTGFDLIIAGATSTDGAGGVLPAMLAEHLAVPHLTALSSVELGEGTVAGTRESESGVRTVSAQLPAVISITEALPDARFANFKGIIAAKKKPYELLTVGDLGIDPDDVGIARSIMIAIERKPPRTAGLRITDEGDAGQRIADYLVENNLA